MKKTFTLFMFCMSAFVAKTIAQPVVTSSLTSVPVGTIDSAYGASPTVLPGAGGAAVTWDMSSVTTVFAAKLTVVTPSSTPYASTFATSTFCTKVEGTTTSYNYCRQTTAGFEYMSITYGGVGVGTDFNPNGRMGIPFPFHYLDTKTDTFQSTTSVADTVRLTYDGYGTLKTPFYTYSNVIRIKEEYAASTSYSWYTISPFALVMSYSSSSNNYVIVTQKPSTTTAVQNIAIAIEATLYPNPTSGDAVLKMNIAEGYDDASLVITDITGKVVNQIPVTSAETTVHTNDLTSGMYFYTVRNAGTIVNNGKFVVSK